ncbi:Ig-like protein group 4 [Salsuginibacillus halophilus]|uniref:Ig-like protein group 4 n=1 Tax=Salsuginibacillus halophilus TaxID=517424 RepID=A0A2P8HQG9_9BACI|nr:putative Ig domain-containing protein [Salsuginibacillus halophilus]PSL48434.1 Ig-like protein group 4 [Salsuginibacillus halophilus]
MFNKRLTGSALTAAGLLLFAGSAAAADGSMSLGDERALENEVTIPLVLQDVDDLDRGQFEITAPRDGTAFTFSDYDVKDAFQDHFHVNTRQEDHALVIDFSSRGGAVDFDRETVLELTFTPEEADQTETTINILNHDLENSSGNSIIPDTYGGTLEHGHKPGDPAGEDRVSPASAIQVLQHVSGHRPMSDGHLRDVADVSSNGYLTTSDAQAILRKAIGTQDSFLSIMAPESTNILEGQAVTMALGANHGNPPYTYNVSSGSLPRGLELDENSGTISGTPTRDEERTFELSVTDRLGDTAFQELSIRSIESEIEQVAHIPTITMASGDSPDFPARVEVTYESGDTSLEIVEWDDFDAEEPGLYPVYGELGDTLLNIQTEVLVQEEPAILDVDANHQGGIFSLHELYVDTTDEVFTVQLQEVEGENEPVSFHYEGGEQYSLATPQFDPGTEVRVEAHNRYEELIDVSYLTMP